MDDSLRDVLHARRNGASLWWNQTFANRDHIKANPFEQLHSFYPEQQACCNQALSPSLVSSAGQIFSSGFFSPGKSQVYSSTCATCGREWNFDGRDTGILNYNNRYLFDVGNT